MGFKKSWDVDTLESQLRRLYGEIASPYNDGFTAMTCKKELFRVKCLVNDLYELCPTFSGEEEWEKERTMELLKRK
jgi:hypothetical protein